MSDQNFFENLKTRDEKTAESENRLASDSRPAKPRIRVTSGSSQPILPSNPIPQPHMDRVSLVENPELRLALEILARNGIEVAEPKKKYVKHSYEIEEAVHTEFHQMYAVLGFKHVKTAINDAIKLWCTHHRAEYTRRKKI